jgi:hypothetical protein
MKQNAVVFWMDGKFQAYDRMPQVEKSSRRSLQLVWFAIIILFAVLAWDNTDKGAFIAEEHYQDKIILVDQGLIFYIPKEMTWQK